MHDATTMNHSGHGCVWSSVRTLLFALLVLIGVPVVAAGWWAMVRGRRRSGARQVTAADRTVDRRPNRDDGAATAGLGQASGCPAAPPSRGARLQRDGGWAATGHDDVHIWVGAYVLEALDATDTRTVQEHLFDCGACRAELAEFAMLLTPLGRLTAEDVIAGPHADF